MDTEASCCETSTCHWLKGLTYLQISTIGYGDITPQQPAETAIALCVELLGVLIFGVLLGSITELLSRASRLSRRAALFRQKMVGVNDYMNKRKMPRRIKNRIKSYYAEVRPRCDRAVLAACDAMVTGTSGTRAGFIMPRQACHVCVEIMICLGEAT